MSYYTGSINGFDPEVTFYSPKGDMHVSNVYAVSTAYIETNNRGQNFVIVESGKKKQRVNCGSVGEAETFLRDITKYIRSTNVVYVDSD